MTTAKRICYIVSSDQARSNDAKSSIAIEKESLRLSMLQCSSDWKVSLALQFLVYTAAEKQPLQTNGTHVLPVS